MDYLEQKFKNYKGIGYSPPLGHALRFEKKLKKTEQKYKKLQIYAYTAACLIIIVLVISYMNSNSNFNEQKIILSSENEEIIETEKYLKHEIEQRIFFLNKLNKKNIENLEISDLNESLSKLEEDYNNIPGDPRVVEAVLNTYFLKIKTLDNIIEVLQKNI